MKQTLSGKETFIIGLMLFALFLGAGNMIFPPLLGQSAGENVWIAVAGFLITGVGLPLLGVVAVGLSGNDVQSLARKVHPLFGVAFPIIMYLAIGPMFGIPRTGTVAFEIGVTPYLPEEMERNGISLLIYTVVFFSITYALALNPAKLVDRIGKILTPALLAVLALLMFKAFATPMGTFQPTQEPYTEGAFFTGFLEGYLTMDTIAALVFGIVIVTAIKERGVTSRKAIAGATVKAGLVAAAGMAAVYLSLAYLGATSVESIGYSENGAVILSNSATYLYGSLGTAVLSLAITFACLTTSVGLVSACGNYFSKILPSISYRTVILIVTIFGAVIANIGLTQLIAFSLPILVAIYPLAIVLILLSFLDPLFKGSSLVYGFSILLTGIFSMFDGLTTANINLGAIETLLEKYLPFFEIGIGWVIPALIGGILGFILSFLRPNHHA
ncbi:branched-chain amino acid transport system II carrier protein [Bacillus lacus]|uniref:Branched-chain amino acid transport system carrier protein n=1 Tax=Metabacillus lacus TaxID=1983721 RepID=A0A7X2IZN3_9BACI|nr:branched-chain amino acid transport system II carrier protein [Metabacillus lacus]MRX72753.1 branched-chain amino acid transport system II carrier protein [Metabacillus lacus]